MACYWDKLETAGLLLVLSADPSLKNKVSAQA